MCGIAGFVTLTPRTEPEGVLVRMTEVMHHRGPDAHGFYRDAYASLGHRRLSIIDLQSGLQPMCNEDGGLWITYNGEIFNHADLRPVLQQAGHCYKTHCDTEAILHAYEEYGPDCLSRFRGMFSFAVWNKSTRTLFCARDRLGKKPFYYYWDGRLFAFASEIKSLLEHPSISPALEESVLPEHLHFGYTSDDRTLFSRIRKLMPGHYLLLTPEGLTTQRYWEIPRASADAASLDETSWIRECRRRLEETVRLRLMSDVPLGMFLSGGVDSSAIAALMKQMVNGPVKTFAVGYREDAFSELGYARQVAGHIGTEHEEVVVGMDDFFQALPRLVWHEDEPLAWPSSVSLYFVSRLASHKVKVVLTGEGSDELFAGYGRYRFYLLNRQWMRYYRHVPASLRSVVRGWIAGSSRLSASLRSKLQHSFLGQGEDLETLYLDNFFAAFSGAEQRRLMTPSHQSPAGAYESYRRWWNSRPEASLLARMLYADQKTYLVELLMKQDQMSMAASIESRVPFLDHPFVEFAASIPDQWKLRNGTGKYILKRAVEDLLPRDIIDRKKMGFPTPLRQWLMDPRTEVLYAFLLRRDGLLAAYLDLAYLERLLTLHREGLENATDRIWRLLNLQIWGDLFLTGKREQVWEGLLTGTAASAR